MANEKPTPATPATPATPPTPQAAPAPQAPQAAPPLTTGPTEMPDAMSAPASTDTTPESIARTIEVDGEVVDVSDVLGEVSVVEHAGGKLLVSTGGEAFYIEKGGKRRPFKGSNRIT